MQAFEEWFSIFPPNDPFRKKYRELVAKAAWMAALEWVLKNHLNRYEVYYLIREELEN